MNPAAEAGAGMRWSVVSGVASAGMTALGLWHGLHGIVAFREWRRWRTADPSLADFFLTELEIEIAFAVACLVVAGLLGVATRWLSRHGRSDEHARSD